MNAKKQSIYLIEKTWTDNLENDTSACWGYTVVGFVETEKEAKKIVKAGGVHSEKDCWAFTFEWVDCPTRYRYTCVNYYIHVD